jgi:hypothetical protein
MAKTAYNSRCKICTHPDRGRLDLLLARSVSAVQIAAKVPGVSVHALHRHRARHLPQETLQRLKAQSLRALVGKNVSLAEIRDSEHETLLQTIIALRAEVQGLISQAIYDGNLTTASSLIGRLTDLLALSARIVGEVTSGQTTYNQSIVVSPEYLKLRAVLIKALLPHPAAKRDVARALRELEDPSRIEAPIEIEATVVDDPEPATTGLPPSTDETAIPQVGDAAERSDSIEVDSSGSAMLDPSPAGEFSANSLACRPHDLDESSISTIERR